MYLYIQDDHVSTFIIDLSTIRTLKASESYLYIFYKDDEYDKLYFKNSNVLQNHAEKIYEALIKNNSLKIVRNKEL